MRHGSYLKHQQQQLILASLSTDDLGSGQFFQTNSDGSWPPQLAFDLSSAGLHALTIPTLHPAHLSVSGAQFNLI